MMSLSSPPQTSRFDHLVKVYRVSSSPAMELSTAALLYDHPSLRHDIFTDCTTPPGDADITQGPRRVLAEKLSAVFVPAVIGISERLGDWTSSSQHHSAGRSRGLDEWDGTDSTASFQG